MVEDDLYRSSAPEVVNFPFLDTLQLKTIIYLSADKPKNKLILFCEEQNIDFVRPEAVVSQSQSKLTTLPEEAVIQCLDMMLDPLYYPLLVSCKLGRHKTGMVIGCLRKLMRWSLTSIFAEYQRYAHGTRLQNEQFIELFDSDLVNIPELPVVWYQELLETHRQICELRAGVRESHLKAGQKSDTNKTKDGEGHDSAPPKQFTQLKMQQKETKERQWSMAPHRALQDVYGVQDVYGGECSPPPPRAALPSAADPVSKADAAKSNQSSVPMTTPNIIPVSPLRVTAGVVSNLEAKANAEENRTDVNKRLDTLEQMIAIRTHSAQ